ncbi:hypothetical protein JCM8202_000921 [Rhodotorula sphaerocarpa]
MRDYGAYELVGAEAGQNDPDDVRRGVDDALECGGCSSSDDGDDRARTRAQRLSCSSRLWTLTAAVTGLLVAGGLLLALRALVRSHARDGRSERYPQSTELCGDAYNTFGYIWRGKSPTEIRWIPYDTDEELGEAALGLRPDSYALSNATSPPGSVLARAPPSWNSVLNASRDLSGDERLDFMRGRTVLFVGDSHDRKGVEGFCAHHRNLGAKLGGRGGHTATRCEIPSLDFTLANWFHYGMPEREEEWYGAGLSPGMDLPPYSIEDRLRDAFEPDLVDIGQPDLIVLNSVYWDLRYFARKAQHEGWQAELQRSDRPLTWDELRWHRSRLRSFVMLFRERFPGTKIMYRPGQLRADNAGSGNVAVYQINESAQHVMAELGVPIFPWGAHLIGDESYVDDMHFPVVSQATYLFGDMALYYLYRVVEGTWVMRGPGGGC